MEQTHFEPQYPLRHYALALLAAMPGLAGVAVCAGLGLGRPWVIVSVVLLVALPVVLRFSHVRRVTFDQNLVVVRLLLRDRYCNYQEILQVNREYLWTERGRVRIAEWLNREAFLEVLRGLRDQGKLDKNVFAQEVRDSGQA
jgi:hypothetical protein